MREDCKYYNNCGNTDNCVRCNGYEKDPGYGGYSELGRCSDCPPDECNGHGIRILRRK